MRIPRPVLLALISGCVLGFVVYSLKAVVERFESTSRVTIFAVDLDENGLSGVRGTYVVYAISRLGRDGISVVRADKGLSQLKKGETLILKVGKEGFYVSRLIKCEENQNGEIIRIVLEKLRQLETNDTLRALPKRLDGAKGIRWKPLRPTSEEVNRMLLRTFGGISGDEKGPDLGWSPQEGWNRETRITALRSIAQYGFGGERWKSFVIVHMRESNIKPQDLLKSDPKDHRGITQEELQDFCKRFHLDSETSR